MILVEKIIKYGLYLLVFLLPWQTRWIIKAGQLAGGYSEYSTISLYATDILIIGLLVLFIVYQLKVKRLFNFNDNFSIYCWLAIFELIIFLSIFWATDKTVAVFSYLRILLALGLFWLVASFNYDRVKFVWSFLLGAALQAALAIWQFLCQSSFSNKWLGLANHPPGELGSSVIEIADQGVGERWLRAYGGLDHPNILGALMVMAIILACWWYFTSIKTTGSLNKEIDSQELKQLQFGLQKKARFRNLALKERWMMIIFWPLIIIFFTALFFSFSRAAWLTLLAAISSLLAVIVVSKNLLLQKRILEIILILGVVFFILSNQFFNLFTTRLTGQERLEIKSRLERIELYKNFYQLIKDNYLKGVGIGNYTIYSQGKLITNQASYYYQSVHNSFLLIWSEIGIFGLLSFLILIFLIIKKVYHQIKLNLKKEKINQQIKLILLAAILLLMLFDHWWWSLHFGLISFWLITGFINKNLS